MLPTPCFNVCPALRDRLSPRLCATLARRTRRAAQLLRLRPAQLRGLGLRIVDDVEMARLHLAFMGEQGPTDVLSFSPKQQQLGGDAAGVALAGMLGDIVIDWDAVLRQACSPTAQACLDEATVLVVHGLAHLLGHDHRDLREGRRMHRLEQRVLRGLRVADRPRPYAPRLRARAETEPT